VPPKIAYFFRKPTTSFYSIELLFDTIMKRLKNSTAVQVNLPHSLGGNPLAMIRNCFYARSRQGQVNHITGEIYYIALALKRQSTVLTIHDVDSLGSSNKLKDLLLHYIWLKLPARRVKYVTVVSEYSKQKLLNATGIAADKVVVIPNSVPFAENDFIPKAHINKQEPVLLQVGTKSNKNLVNLVSAINGLYCKLIIIGKLSEEQKNHLEANSINYELFHSLEYAEVVSLYYRADIVTFVSTYEGFGMPILEANALGRPVITSTTASMPEVAGTGALLVNPHNPLEIRAAIDKLIIDDEFRSELVALGYKNAQRFKPEVVAAMYEDLYERVLLESK
jgi:glycosyltransferase involved in cell wall biosynthesis